MAPPPAMRPDSRQACCRPRRVRLLATVVGMFSISLASIICSESPVGRGEGEAAVVRQDSPADFHRAGMPCFKGNISLPFNVDPKKVELLSDPKVYQAVRDIIDG